MKFKIRLYITAICLLWAGNALAQRVTNGQIALYQFNEGGGNTVNDVSGFGTPLNLQIDNTDSVTWQTGALTVDGSTVIRSTVAATKLYNAITSSGEFTLEAWVEPANTIYTGFPRRILAYSANLTTVNATLRQVAGDNEYEGRVRTSTTFASGNIGLLTTTGAVTTNLTHVVMTRNAAGITHLYINDNDEGSVSPGGNLSVWNNADLFALANEVTYPADNAGWQGTFHLVSVYSRALNASEIDSNFTAGISQADDAQANISPTIVTRNQGAVSFTYTIDNITSSTPDFGKADKIIIKNPFPTETMYVSSVQVDGTEYFIKKDTVQPTATGFAAWNYDPVTDSLYVRTADFDIDNEIIIEFVVNVPNDPLASVSFPSWIDGVLDPTPPLAITTGTYDVQIDPSRIAFYSVTPSTVNTTAGSTINLQVRAFDSSGNPVTTDNSTDVRILISGSRIFPNDTLVATLNAGVINTSFADSASEQIRVLASSLSDSTISGTSPLITINTAAEDHIRILSSLTTLTAGAERQLRIGLEDRFDNRIAGASVTLNSLEGRGYFPASGFATINTNTDGTGVAEALFVATDTLNLPGFPGSDSINVVYGTVDTTFGIPLGPGPVSYYTFTPAGNVNFTAGNNTGFVVTARDQYGNAVLNSGSVNLTAPGASGANFPGGVTRNFSGDSVITVQVNDSTVESFTVRAVNTVNNQIKGQSGLITVGSASGDHIVVLSDTSSLAAGGERLLQIALEDLFTNRIAGQNITLTTVQGTGYFVTPGNADTTIQTGSSGAIQVPYTASSTLSTVRDSINIVAAGIDTTIGIRLRAGSVAYYLFMPEGASSISAGDTLNFALIARDQYDNGVINNGTVNLSSVGTSVNFIDGTNFSFLNDSSFAFRVSATTAGIFTLKAVNTVNFNLTGTGGPVTVNPGAGDHITILSSLNPIVTGNERTIQLSLEDEYDNALPGIPVTLTRFQGNGYFGTKGNADTTINTNVSGQVNVAYTASDSVSFVYDSIRVQSGSVDTSIGFMLNAGAVTYYTFSPAGNTSFTAGNNVVFTLTARDRYGNATSGGSVNLTALGGSSVSFPGGTTRVFGGLSTIAIQVTDTISETFTVRAANTSKPEIKGESGLITVNPAAANSFTVLSPPDPIIAGTERLLRVRLADQYNNPIPSATVTFTAQALPSDAFLGTVSGTKIQNINTDASGIAEVLFTASTDISLSPDVIQVSDGGTTSTAINLTLLANNVSYYTFSPTGNRNFNAGANLVYTLTARDQFGNGVLNSEDVTLSAFSGTSVSFTEGTARNFGGDSMLTATITSTLAQSFTLRAVNDTNGEIKGESDLVTVLPAAPDHLTMLSAADPINIRGSRQLRAALEDVYANRISGSTVTFTARRGNGYFGAPGNADTVVAVDENGVYQTPYTASDNLSFVSDSIDVISAGVAIVPQTFILQQASDNVAYYTFSPSGAQNITAGGNVIYTITARDQFGNGVLNNGNINLSTVGGGAVSYTPDSTLVFGGDSSVTVTVSTDRAQQFTVRAENSGNSQIAGQSSLITVNPAAGDHFVIVSSVNPITVGSERLLQVRLGDQYNNPVPSATVTFTATTGDGYFGTPGTTVTTDATDGSGIAEANFTASSVLAVGTDVIQAALGGVTININLPLRAAQASYYTFAPSGNQTVTAGDSLGFTVTARDQYGNAVANSDSVDLSAVGSTTAGFTNGGRRYFGGASSITFNMADTTAGSFNIRAASATNGSTAGQSGLITVNPAAGDHFVIVSSLSQITVGTERLLQVRLEDLYNNPVPSATVTFTATTGDGYFGTPGTTVTTDATDGSGIAGASFTASSDLAVGTDVIQAALGGVTININLPLRAAQTSYYTFAPSGNQTVTAGDSLGFTVTARDQYGNAVANGDSVDLSAVGSTTAGFTSGGRRYFGGAVSITFNVADTTAGSFNVRAASATNGSTAGQSGLITVNPAAGDHFVIISSVNPITVGSERLLQVRLEDQYNNPVPSATVTFTATTGDGYFGTPGTTVTTDATNSTGIAGATYTASSSLAVGTDVIQAALGGVTINISLPLQAASVSYYTFTPVGNVNFTAGGSTNFTVTARDQHGNGVLNSGFVNLSALGASGAGFPGGATPGFGGDSVISVQVNDNLAETFTVRAENSGNSQIKGESGLVTVGPAAADHFVILSSTGQITVGTERLLQVRLEDQYNNPVLSAAVTFSAPALPSDAFFGTDSLSKDSTVTANASDVAEILYTATSDLALGPDQIGVSDGGTINTTINLTLRAANVSYYTFTPTGSVNFTAGGSTNFTLTARDQHGNGVVNSGFVNLSAPGASGAGFPGGLTRGFSGDSVIAIQVTDNTAETFTVRAVNTVNSQIKGESGLVTVGPAAADHFVILSSINPITVGTERQLQVRLEDQYNNPVPSALVTFSAPALPSDAFFGSDSLSKDSTVTANTSGVAEILYTASSGLALSPDQIGVSDGGTINTTINLTLRVATVSYYTFTPAGNVNFTAGGNTSFTLTARDQFGNAVVNNSSVNLTAVGAAGAVFTGGTPRSFGGASAITIQVSDTIAESFTVRAVNTANSQVKGESGLVAVSAAALDYVLIRTRSNNGGEEFGDSTFTAGQSIMLYAAGYDSLGNYLSDVPVTWSGLGLNNTVSGSGSSYRFAPIIAPDAGRIISTHSIPGVASDTSGILTVSEAALARIVIQSARGAGQPPVQDVNITSDDSLVLYAAGYDTYGNYLGETGANWTVTNGIGQFLTPSPLDSAVFDARLVGAGVIRATSQSVPSIYDNTGSITVGKGSIASLLIRTAPGGSGAEATTDTVVAGGSRSFYAAGYDADNNYVADQAVDWGSTGDLSGFGTMINTSVLELNPTLPGSGLIYTVNGSGWSNDSTGLIVAQAGNLKRIAIRTGANNTGVEVDTLTRTAGTTISLYAAGYDLQDNYIGDQNVAWFGEGDSIGFFDADSGFSNIFNFRKVNAANFRIMLGTLHDNSGIIKVRAAAPDTIIAISSTTFSGAAGTQLSQNPEVQVWDAFMNPVPNITVSWVTPTDGSLTPLSPATNELGRTSASWRLKSTIVPNQDSAFAIVASIPDTVIFTASVLSSSAASISYVSGTGQSGTVATSLAQPFIVSVEDSLGNPINGQTINFQITSLPQGGGDYQFVPSAIVQTGADGRASVTFTFGTKTGDYTISAGAADVSGSISFTASATPASAQNLAVFTGNSQADTAGQVLPQPIVARVFDQYLNLVPGAAVIWLPGANGDTLNAQTVTDMNGRVQASWRLPTASGPAQLGVSLTGLDTAFFNAVAVADKPVGITAFSGNNTTTFAGSGRPVIAQVFDQHGNTVSDATVRFSSTTGQVAGSSVATDGSGMAGTLYTTPADLSQSTARAVLRYNNAPVDTADFLVYGITYLNNSLTPKAVKNDTTIGFSLSYYHPGPADVTLNTTSTVFSFTDGAQTASGTLSSPAALTAGDTTTLLFGGVTIPAAMSQGNYTARVRFTDASAGSDTISGVLTTGPGELTVSPLVIQSVTLPVSTVSRGDTIGAGLVIFNNSPYTIRNLSGQFIFNPSLNAQIVPDGPVPDSVLTRESVTLQYQLAIPASAAEGTYIVDGKVSGNLSVPGNDLIRASGALNTASLNIQSAANLAFDSFSPDTVSDNQTPAFTATVHNNGAASVLLDQNTSSIAFGTQTWLLDGNQAVTPGGAATTLHFRSIPNTLSAGRYQGSLTLNGAENGAPFDTTFTIDSLQVQNRAQLVLAGVTLSDTTVSQGESGQTLTLEVRNTGQAAAGIASSSAITIQRISTYSFLPVTTFPLTIAGGGTGFITYNIIVNVAAATGPDTMTAHVNYTDLNSGLAGQASDAAVTDIWTVLSSSSLNILSINAVNAKVSRGQTGVPVTMDIRNTGGVPVVFGLNGISLAFSNNTQHSTVLTAPVLPDTLPALTTRTYMFSVEIYAAAATGAEQIGGQASGTSLRTGQTVSTSAAGLDSWLVQTEPSVLITGILNSRSEVNSGQQNLDVRMRIVNQGQATALLDSAGLFTIPSGNTTDTLLTVLDSLAGGKVDTLYFNSDLSGVFTGTMTVDGKINYRDKNDTTRAFVSSGAVNPHIWNVSGGGQLVVDSVSASVPAMTLGQSGVLVSAVVRNNGGAPVRLDSLRFVFDGQINRPPMSATRVSPSTLPTLTPGQSLAAVYRINAASSPADSGYISLDLRAYGTDQNSLNHVSAAGSVKPDSILLQTPANLRAIAIVNPSDVLQNQDDIAVTMTIRNSGGAAAQVNNVFLDFKNGNTFYNREIIIPAIPFDLPGGTDTTISFLVDVLSNAPLGADSLSGRVQFFEYNRSLSLNSSSGTLSTWMVQGTGGISVLSAVSTQDSVSTGQDSIMVRVRVANSGNNAVVVDSVRIAMTRGSYTASSLILTPGTSLNPASRAVYDFLVALTPSSETGVASINASVFGRDSFTSGPVSDLSADTTDTWLIQRAVSILITSVNPTQVSIGQPIQPVVQIRNTGQARLVVDTSRSRLVSDGFTLRLPDNLIIDGNSSYNLTFNTETVSGVSGKYPYTLDLFGNENGSFYNSSTIADDSLSVQTQAALVIDSIAASQDTVTQGMQADVNVYLRNTGMAALRIDTLTVNPYGTPAAFAPAIPLTVGGNSNMVVQSTVDIPAGAATGMINLTATASGRDLNSNTLVSDKSESVSDSWTVLSQPQIVIDSVYSDSSVTLGQNGILIRVDISNSGQTPVSISSLTINRKIGLYTHLGPALPVILAGNSSLTLVDTLSVATNSAVGNDTLTASINYTNLVSGGTAGLTGIAYWPWLIRSSSNLDIVSVTTPNEFVSRGQTGIPVQVRVRNKGSVLARLESLTLRFTNGDTNYVISGPNPLLPATIPPAATINLDYTFNINAGAFPGADTMDAGAVVTEISTGRVDTLYSALTTDSWVVQQRPLISINQVTIVPGVASAGQAGIRAEMDISNAAGPDRATAVVNPVDLHFLINGSDADANFIITRLSTPVVPFNLAGGQSITVAYNVTVAGGAPDTLYTVDGSLGYQDLNDGTSLVTPSALQKDTLEVRTAAGLVITGFDVIPDTVGSGQDSVRAMVSFQNTGSSAAEVRYTSLRFSVANNNFFYVLVGHAQTPFTIAGNSADTLNYLIRVPATISGAVTVTDSIRALDLVSGQTTVASAQTPFYVQSPPAPQYVSGSLSPAFTDVGVVDQFTIRVINLGQSAIRLDSTKTILRFNGVPAGTFGALLSGSSDQTIGSTLIGNDTTDLVFRPQTIPNIPVGVYSVEVDLIGTSNQAFFSQTISTGDVSIGGDLLITGGSVAPVTVIQGQTGLIVNFTVANRGAAVPVESAGTTIEVRDASNQVVLVDNLLRLDTVDTLLSIENNTLRFQFDAPITFDGSYTIYGLVKPQGLSQLGPTEIASFNVFSGADLVYVTGSLNPQTAVPSENIQFAMSLFDNGTSGLNLKPDSTILTIDFPTALHANLAANYALDAQDTTDISFKNITIPAGAAPGSYGMHLRTYGNPSFDPLNVVSQTIDLSDSIRIVSQGAVEIVSLNLSDSVVSQGETSQSLDLQIRNAGAGSVRINSATDITLLYNSQYSFQLTSGQTFPLSIAAGNTVDLTYGISVNATAVTGSDSIRSRINFTDVASGVGGIAGNSAVYAAWRVLSGAGIQIPAIVAAASQVSQGQDSLLVTIRVRNSGEVPLIIPATTDLGLKFSNNTNYIASVTGPALPDTIGSLDSTDFTFRVAVGAAAATGNDQIAAVVSGRNQRTGASVGLTGAYLDSWLVQTPASVVITSTYNSFINVNSGQQNLQVEMRLRNQGGAAALLDTAGLFTSPLAQISDSLVSTLSTFPGGARDTVRFVVDINPGFTGNLTLDGFVNYRDGNDTTRNLAASGAVNPHIWNVGTPAGLQIDSLVVSRPTIALGQSGVAVMARVTNTGTAQIRIDSLRFVFDGQINRPPMSAVRVSPATLPVLASGQGFDAIFNLSAAMTPRDSGDIALNLRAYGTDQITLDRVSALTALQPDTILLQTPADVYVVDILNPPSVVQDTTGITVEMIIQNRGSSDARIDNVLLDFKNGNNFYNRNIIQPALPFILAGGARDTVEFSVDVLSTAPVGIDSLAGRVQYVELNRNLNLLYTSKHLSSWQVVGSGGLAALAVLSDVDTASTGQDNIPVRLVVANSGNNSVRIDSLRITSSAALLTGTLFIPTGADSILDSTAVDTFYFNLGVDTNSPVGTFQLNASVYGRDTYTSGLLADNTADQRHILQIQKAANLRYISRITGPAGALDTLVSAGQAFTVSTTVSNIGQAGFTSGMLRLDTPANYSVAQPLISYRSPDTLMVNWNVTAVAPGGPGFDNLSVVLVDSSRDANSGKLAGIDRFDNIVPVRTEAAATATAGATITQPAGATDGNVSTGQVFTARVMANFNPAVLGTGRIARIVLPPNYSVQTSTQKNFRDNITVDSLKWNVIAPGLPSGPDSIWVLVEVRDRNTDQILTFNSDTLNINTGLRSQISVSASIISPAGAIDGTLSSRQQFVTGIRVDNPGSPFDNTGVLGVSATNGVRIVDPQNQNLVDTLRIQGFEQSTDTIYQVTAQLPANTISSSILKAEILTRPHDVNSGNLVATDVSSSPVSISVQSRAELTVDLLENNLQDTILVWQNQDLNINTVVRKSGIAPFDAQKDSGYVRINFPSANLALRDSSSHPRRQSFTDPENDGMSWKVKTKTGTGITYIEIYQDTLFSDGPYDGNDGLPAFRTISSRADTLWLDVRAVALPQITANFSQPIVKPDSLTSSTEQDSIEITATVQIDPLLNRNRRAVLQLPAQAGYTSQDTSRTRNMPDTGTGFTLKWLLRAPQNPVDWRSLSLELSGNSVYNPDTSMTVVYPLAIRTVTRARLRITKLDIIDPPGAAETKSVSQGQIFTIESVIRNDGAAGIAAGDSGDIILRSIAANPYLTVIGPATRKYSENDTVRWQVQVGNTGGNELTETMEVELLSVPADENTGLPAGVANLKLSSPEITIVGPATMNIAGTTHQDTLSTSQTFLVTATFNKTENVTNAFAIIHLPDWFAAANTQLDTVITLNEGQTSVTVNWNVTIPDKKNNVSVAAAGMDSIRISYRGEDRLAGNVPVAVTPAWLPLYIQPRAQIKLIKNSVIPNSINNGFVSKGEELTFTLAVTRDNLTSDGQHITNMSGIEGIVSVVIQIDTSFTSIQGDVDEKTAQFSSDTDTLFFTWKRKAPPDVLSATTVSFILNQFPIDVNSQQETYVTGVNRLVAYPIAVRENELQITNLTSDMFESAYAPKSRSYARGTKNAPILSFLIDNRSSGDNPATIDTLRFDFRRDPQSDNYLSKEDLQTMFAYVRLVNWDKYVALYQDQQIALSKAAKDTLSVDLQFYFDDVLDDAGNIHPSMVVKLLNYKLNSGENERLVLMVDLNSGKDVPIGKFFTRLWDVHAWDADPTVPSTISDSRGGNFETSDEFNQNLIGVDIAPDNPEEAFLAFPNPFGRTEDATIIRMFLEQTSDIQLRVYTITGQLVRTIDRSGLESGTHTEITWDGRNDRGSVVLNGVYLCQVQIQEKEGARRNLKYMIKIAYIK